MGICRVGSYFLAFPLGKGDRIAVEGVVRRTLPNCGMRVSMCDSPSGRNFGES